MLEVQAKQNPFREYADAHADVKNKNKTSNIIIDGKDTNIPNNVPVCIIGEKGAGKTTLLTSIVELTHQKGIYKHYYVVYSNNNLDEELPDYVTMVPVAKAESFLASLFEIKSIYNSYYRLFKSTTAKKLANLELDKIDNAIRKYNQAVFDSNVDDRIKIDRILQTGYAIMRKFSTKFTIGGVSIDGIHPDDLDCLIIDDLAIASPILFKDIKNSPLYEYFTLTRHMRLGIYLAGQQIDQLPASLRREIQCWLFSKDTQSFHLLKNIISRESLINIQKRQGQLENKYEFVVFNRITGVISTL